MNRNSTSDVCAAQLSAPSPACSGGTSLALLQLAASRALVCNAISSDFHQSQIRSWHLVNNNIRDGYMPAKTTRAAESLAVCATNILAVRMSFQGAAVSLPNEVAGGLIGSIQARRSVHPQFRTSLSASQGPTSSIDLSIAAGNLHLISRPIRRHIRQLAVLLPWTLAEKFPELSK